MTSIQSDAAAGAVVLTAREGEALNVLGDRHVVKVGAAETNGLLTIVEATIEPQSGPPLHLHEREDESFYVLEGEFAFSIGGQTVQAGAGGFVYAPRGQAHTFKNIGPNRGRFLVTATPAGIEVFFRRLSELPPGPPDVPRVVAIAREYGIVILPPPE